MPTDSVTGGQNDINAQVRYRESTGARITAIRQDERDPQRYYIDYEQVSQVSAEQQAAAQQRASEFRAEATEQKLVREGITPEVRITYQRQQQAGQEFLRQPEPKAVILKETVVKKPFVPGKTYQTTGVPIFTKEPTGKRLPTPYVPFAGPLDVTGAVKHTPGKTPQDVIAAITPSEEIYVTVPEGTVGMVGPSVRLNPIEQFIAEAQQRNIEANLRLQSSLKPQTQKEQTDFLRATGIGFGAGVAAGVYGGLLGTVGAIQTLGRLQREPRKAQEVAKGIYEGILIGAAETGRQLKIAPSFVAGEVFGTIAAGEGLGILGAKGVKITEAKTAKYTVSQTAGLGEQITLFEEGGIFRGTEAGSFKTVVTKESLLGKKTYEFDTGIRSVTISSPLTEKLGITRTVGAARTVGEVGKRTVVQDIGFALQGIVSKEAVPHGFDFLSKSFGKVITKSGKIIKETDVGAKFLSRSVGTTQEAELFGSVGVTATAKGKKITQVEKMEQIFRAPLTKASQDISDLGMKFGPVSKTKVGKGEQLIKQNIEIIKPTVAQSALDLAKAQQEGTKRITMSLPPRLSFGASTTPRPPQVEQKKAGRQDIIGVPFEPFTRPPRTATALVPRIIHVPDQDQRPITGTGTIQVPIQVPMITPKQDVIIIAPPIQTTTPVTLQKFILKPPATTKIPRPFVPTVPFIPTTGIPPLSGGFSLFGGNLGRRKRRGGRRRYAYSPQIYSILTGKKAKKAPSVLTGINIRPVIIGNILGTKKTRKRRGRK